MSRVPIRDKIHAFLYTIGEHHRYRSWEHCFGYFHKHATEAIAANLDEAALRLGFYVANWGMYRDRVSFFNTPIQAIGV